MSIDIGKLVGLAVDAAKLAGGDQAAFKRLAGGAVELLRKSPDPATAAEAARLERGLADAEAARRAASGRMRDAGSYRPR